LSFAALVVPRGWSQGEKAVAFGALALVANAPDLPLPLWAHESYRVSHSLFVNLALMAGVLGLLLVFRVWRGRPGSRWVVAGGAAAWLSHLVLDSFYSHGRGIRIFWPLSDAALTLPIPWFHVVRRGSPPDLATLRIFATEALFYGALLGICLLWRRRWKLA
jgi:membrane-bound metal-dependent hydrolase YbcI (DUF457 family)